LAIFNANISQGSAVIRLRCDSMFSDYFAANLLHNSICQ